MDDLKMRKPNITRDSKKYIPYIRTLSSIEQHFSSQRVATCIK